MPSLGEQLQHIGLLAAHEAAMGDLYEAYAARLPEHADLFRELAEQERAHARELASWTDEARRGLVQVTCTDDDAAVVLKSLDLVRKRTREAQTQSVTPEAAFATARHLEDALLEREYLGSLRTEVPAFAALLERLTAETAEHRARLSAAR